MTLNRRQVLTGTAALAAAGACTVVAAPAPVSSIQAAATKAGILFGTCIEQEVYSDLIYAQLIRDHCGIVINANALKFDFLRPTGPEIDYWVADRLLAWAEASKIPFRATNLVWNDYLPDWLKATSKREVIGIFDRHIDEVASRYSGRIQSWDVVNEPFAPWDGQPGVWRKGAWYNALGPGYIERAFRRAAKADPKCKLVLNEAFCEQDDEVGKAVRPELLKLVRSMRDKDVPIHAVGLQAHLKPQLPYDDQHFARFVSDLADEKVDIYLTELDVDDSTLPEDPIVRDEKVAARYRDFLGAVLAVPAVNVVIMWGLADGYTWYNDLAKESGSIINKPRPLPFDRNLQPKAQHLAIIEAFNRRKG
jgi:endo-1,4-beta-xylanase